MISREYTDYIKFYFLGLNVLVFLIPFFNLFVDPFWYYRFIEIKGFNIVKPAFADFEAEIKPLILASERPQAVIMGSSYSSIGLDPLHPGVKAGLNKSYNFGMIGSPWEDIVCNYRFALSELGPDLKRVVLGINVDGIEDGLAKDCSKKFKTINLQQHVKMLFSLESIKASFYTVLQQDISKATHTREGLFFYTKRASNVWYRFVEELGKLDVCSLNSSIVLPAELEAPEERSPEGNLNGLVFVVKEAIEKGIDLQIIIHPTHAYRYEAKRSSMHEYWQRIFRIVSAVESATPEGRNIPVWIFAGYNELTAESVPRDGAMKYWQDTAHYNNEFGNLMLDKIFGYSNGKREVNENFGYLATTTNLKSLYRRFEEDRRDYIEKHPDFLINFQEVLQAK